MFDLFWQVSSTVNSQEAIASSGLPAFEKEMQTTATEWDSSQSPLSFCQFLQLNILRPSSHIEPGSSCHGAATRPRELMGCSRQGEYPLVSSNLVGWKSPAKTEWRFLDRTITDNHRTKWSIFQQAMFDDRRVFKRFKCLPRTCGPDFQRSIPIHVPNLDDYFMQTSEAPAKPSCEVLKAGAPAKS